MRAGTDIVIAGAGPTGLTAAVELARRGFPVAICERDDGPKALSKAVGISAHSLELLEPTGTTEKLLATGRRIRRIDVCFERRFLVSIDFSKLRHRFNFMLALPQSDTETILAEVLSTLGTEVAWRTELTAVGVDRSGPLVTLRRSGQDCIRHCRYIFGADGMHSAVRQASGIRFSEHALSLAQTRAAFTTAARNAFLRTFGSSALLQRRLLEHVMGLRS